MLIDTENTKQEEKQRKAVDRKWYSNPFPSVHTRAGAQHQRAAWCSAAGTWRSRGASAEGQGEYWCDLCLSKSPQQQEPPWCSAAPCISGGRDRTGTGVEHWVKHAQLASKSKVEGQEG